MAGTLCRRIGPGRLPYANRDDVGGGVAMAATGVLAAACWVGVLGALAALRGTEPLGGSNEVALAALGSALVVPVAIPAAFAVGAVMWRYYVPAGPTPRAGAIAGAVTAAASLAIGAIGAGAIFGSWSALSGAVTAPLDVLVVTLLAIVVAATFAIAFAGWLVLPLGIVGGWYHERAKRSRASRDRT